MSDKKDDNWEMPTPVFRSSAGSLPRSLEDTISRSFMPNAETIEIGESDDILSIMDASGEGHDAKTSGFTGGETILDLRASIPYSAKAPANGDSSTSGAVQKPQAVTPDRPIYDSASNSGDKRSSMVVYFVVALIVAGIIAAVIYYQGSAS